jgi:GT2 family glycosyltransferase/glycosyltransferase involved in cell wall biosynthesis
MDAGTGGTKVPAQSRRAEAIAWRLRQWASLFRRARASLRRRGLRATLRTAWQRLQPAPRSRLALRIPAPAAGSLPALPPAAPSPRASILVPVHGQLAATLQCLHALADDGDTTGCEVIVVDDASSDDSPRVLPQIPHLRYLHLPTNQGFIGACNAGAALARGQFLVLLNNDTVPQPGWLDALLGTFAAHPDTGVAGAMLLYPDGRLQEAGGIVHADGEAANYGRGDDPEDPRYAFVRECDYVSGAALAIPRALWLEMAGLDAHFAPAYYEDTDLAMRVRAAGSKVRYQPAARVVHLEGASAGTDTTRGMKAWQPVNQRRFAERWHAQLARQPDARTPPDLAARWHASPRLLFVDERAPTPDLDSGSVRLVNLMRALLAEGAAVDFVATGARHEGVRTQALQALGVCAWWREDGDFAAWLRAHGRDYDAIVVSRHHVLAPLLPLLRKLAPRAQIVFDSVDLHFLREQREARYRGDSAGLRAAEATQRSELALVASTDRTWVVGAHERDLLAGLAPAARVELVSNAHEPEEATPGPGQRADVVFVGSFAHAPNVDAVEWLLREIWPRVRGADPSLRLHVVGNAPPESLRAMASTPGVVLHGHVAELEELLDRCRVSVAPLRFGAGVKGKVNQAMARGLPVVATACAAEGMQLLDGEDACLAESAEDLAQGILRLCRDDELWWRLRRGGYANTRRLFSLDAVRATLRPWLQELRAR